MDPTYDKEKIEKNPEWSLAFLLSEIMNDNTPMGWLKYIGPAKCVLAARVVLPRGETMVVPEDNDEQGPIEALHKFIGDLEWEGDGCGIRIDCITRARPGDTLVRVDRELIIAVATAPNRK